MITKADWLNIKKTKQYSYELLWEYWIANKKDNYKDISFEEFGPLIQIYSQNGSGFNFNEIEQYFDNKFNIIKLFDKNKQLIKEL